MRESSSQRQKSDSEHPVGIIDTLGLAFALLSRRPYLVWLPVMIDILLWSGLRIRVDDPVPWLTDWGIDFFAGMDLIAVLTLPVPTFLDAFSRNAISSPDVGPRLVLNGAFEGLALIGAIAAAFLVAMTYLTVVGRLVLNQPAWGREFIVDCVKTAVKGISLGTTVFGLFIFMVLPVVALGLVLYLLGAGPEIIIALGAGFLIFWLGMHFIFGIPAVALGERSVPAALQSSYRVVHQNFTTVVGLLIIVFMIRTGVTYALQIFSDSVWSVPFAIVVHAYIVTGLITALMMFFRQRANELKAAHADAQVHVSP